MVEESVAEVSWQGDTTRMQDSGLYTFWALLSEVIKSSVSVLLL